MTTTDTRTYIQVLADLALDIYRAQGAEYVGLATIRQVLADLDLDRADQDQVLLHIARSRAAHIWPSANLKGLTAADRAAALVIGGEACHMMMIG